MAITPHRPRFEPIDISTPFGKTLKNHLIPTLDVVRAERTDNLQVGWCYENCRIRVAEKGGQIRTGYLLLVWRRYFAEALHHAMWESPDGDLQEITGPAYPGLERHEWAYFAPDGKILGADDPADPSKFWLLSNDPTVLKWTKAAIEERETRGRLLELPHKSRVEAGRRLMEFLDPRAQALNQTVDLICKRRSELGQNSPNSVSRLAKMCPKDFSISEQSRCNRSPQLKSGAGWSDACAERRRKSSRGSLYRAARGTTRPMMIRLLFPCQMDCRVSSCRHDPRPCQRPCRHLARRHTFRPLGRRS